MTSAKNDADRMIGSWQEDLPEGRIRHDMSPELPAELANSIDDAVLEISRSSAIMRGLPLLFGIIGLFGYVASFSLVIRVIFVLDNKAVAIIFMLPLLFVGVWFVFLLLKSDLAIPADRPIRFNRVLGKVYVYEHRYSMNPFEEWPVKVNVFDWSELSAKIYCYKGFTGTTYIQRFTLWLMVEGRSDVEGRFQLMGNWPTTKEMHDAWDYCVKYMESGVAGVPACQLREQEVTFRRSLFHYMRLFDPTSDGDKVRDRMTAGDWAFNLPFLLLTFWFFFPMGMAHYFAMRFSPPVVWPEELDKESLAAK